MITTDEIEKRTKGKTIMNVYGGGDHIEFEFTDGTTLNIFGDDIPALTQSPTTPSALDTQYGGDHYKKLGAYQPWEVLRHWLTPEEFRGYMKGTSIAYLACERDKGRTLYIKTAAHTLHALVELDMAKSC